MTAVFHFALPRLATLAPLVLVVACHGHAHARTSASADADDRRWEEQENDPVPSGPPRAAAAPAARVAPAAPSAEPTGFLGVAHDLSLAPSSTRPAACRCLALSYGPPDDAQFVWQADPPKFPGGTMAIAIAADGVACSSPGYAPLRASISALGREGADVVVVVENVSEGRPVMHGALSSPPSPGGAIVVRARRGAPYGAPVGGGDGSCRIAFQ